MLALSVLKLYAKGVFSMTNPAPAYAKMCAKIAQAALADLVTVDTPEKASTFIAQTAKQIRQWSAKTPEFYVGEFIGVFKDMVISRTEREQADCVGALGDVKAEAAAASAELTARYRAASAAGDRVAEHAIWRDREARQEAAQAKVDAITKRAKLIALRLQTYVDLASALGINSAGPAAGATAAQKAKVGHGNVTSAYQPATASLDVLLRELDEFIGLAPVKADVRRLIDTARVEQMRRTAGLPVSQVSRHLVFTGNPGTGKTTVARQLARLYAAIGVLRTGQLIEVTRSDLVAGYVGQTAIKTTEAVKRALGGILFIDEAYSLSRSASGQDYGQEAIDTIVKLMEDHRDELVVIVAGYGQEMAKLITSNPGLPSRFPRTIDFPDYSTDELVSIFQGMCARDKYEASTEAVYALRQFLTELPRNRDFGNGRLMRNIFEAAIGRQASRIVATNCTDLTKLTLADLDLQTTEIPQPGQVGGPGQAEAAVEVRADSASEAVDRLSHSATRPFAGAKPYKGGQSPASTTRSSSGIAAHMRAYAVFTEATLADLRAVSTAETAHAFAAITAQKVRDTVAKNPDFYAGQFFNIFKDAAVAKSQAEIAECEQTRDDAKAEAATGTAQLRERLDAARAASDYQAERDVWREREIRQAAVQAKIDEATKRIDPISMRLEACKELATALGLELS